MTILRPAAYAAQKYTRRLTPRVVPGLLGSVLMSAALLASCASGSLAQQPAGGPKLRGAKAGSQVETLPEPESTAPSTARRFAPIGQLTLGTAISPGLLPPDPAAEVFRGQAPTVLGAGVQRPWPEQVFCWYGVPILYPGHPRCSSCAGPVTPGCEGEARIMESEASGAAAQPEEIERGEAKPDSGQEHK